MPKKTKYVVVGVYADSPDDARYADEFEADDPFEAERMAEDKCADEGGLYVAGVSEVRPDGALKPNPVS